MINQLMINKQEIRDYIYSLSTYILTVGLYKQDIKQVPTHSIIIILLVYYNLANYIAS